MSITILVVSILCFVFAWAFLMAAMLTFAAHDNKPVDHDTDRLLTLSAWSGGWPLIVLLAVKRNWRSCPEARRLFYVGAAAGLAAALLWCGFGALGDLR